MSRSAPRPSGRSDRVSPFGRRAVWIVVAAATAFGVTLFFSVFGGEPVEVVSVGGDTFSRSAVGYHALGAFLEEAGVEVRISRYRTLETVGPGTGLLLLEPPVGEHEAERVAGLVAGAAARGVPTVVVLPKWRPLADSDDRSRAAKVLPLETEWVEGLLAALFEEAGSEAAGLLERSELESAALDGAGPLASDLTLELVHPQVLTGELPNVEALATTSAGAVVVHDPARRLTVVSDPDLLNTHGLGRGDNALLAHRLLVGREGSPATWVVDETLHGYEVVPSMVRELLELPLALFTLQTLLLALLATWAAARRFGRPLEPPPRLEGGSRTLIDNTARLLAVGGDHAEALDRYLDLVVDDGGAAYGAPAGLGRPERVAHLAAAAKRRGVTHDLNEIARRTLGLHGQPARSTGPRALTLARRLWKWREEVVHGAR